MKCFATVYTHKTQYKSCEYCVSLTDSQNFSISIDHFLISFSNNILVIAIIFIIFEK